MLCMLRSCATEVNFELLGKSDIAQEIFIFVKHCSVCEAAAGCHTAQAKQELTCGPGKLPFSFSTAEELSAHTGLACMWCLSLRWSHCVKPNPAKCIAECQAQDTGEYKESNHCG